MNKKQEAQWLYAKGLELAILLRDTGKEKQKEGTVYGIIKSNYHADAIKIALMIHENARALTPTAQT